MNVTGWTENEEKAGENSIKNRFSLSVKPDLKLSFYENMKGICYTRDIFKRAYRNIRKISNKKFLNLVFKKHIDLKSFYPYRAEKSKKFLLELHHHLLIKTLMKNFIFRHPQQIDSAVLYMLYSIINWWSISPWSNTHSFLNISSLFVFIQYQRKPLFMNEDTCKQCKITCKIGSVFVNENIC